MILAKEKKEEKEISDLESGSILIDLNEMYDFDPKDMVPDISLVRYSNFAYIQVTPRDVYVDFLEMPGIKKDNKVIVNGTRVYMSHIAAQKLAEALQGVLEKVHKSGEMEMYKGVQKKEKSN